MPLRLEAAILSRTRSPISSRSNWAKDSSTLRVSRPMLERVLKDWVTDTNETSWASNSSMSLATAPSMHPTSHDARGTAHRRDGRVDGRCLRGVAPPALSPKTPSYDSVAIGIGSGELSRARPAPTTHRGSSTRYTVPCEAAE